MYGEFGRTPKINKNTGRDHWGALQSAVLAGGGIQGGQVYGKSDKQSAHPIEKPVAPRGPPRHRVPCTRHSARHDDLRPPQPAPPHL